jgi:hypothetical protein
MSRRTVDPRPRSKDVDNLQATDSTIDNPLALDLMNHNTDFPLDMTTDVMTDRTKEGKPVETTNMTKRDPYDMVESMDTQDAMGPPRITLMK